MILNMVYGGTSGGGTSDMDTSILYNAGDSCDEVTGGWKTAEVALETTQTQTWLPTLEFNEDNLTIAQSMPYYAGAAYIANKIDLTNYDSLVFEGVMYASSEPAVKVKLCVWTDLGAYEVSNKVASYEGDTTSGVTIDISSLSGEHVIGFFLFHSGTYVTVKKLYLK